MAAYPFGNRLGNSSCSRRCRGGAGAIVSAVSWEGDIASVGGAAGGGSSLVVTGSGSGPAASVGLADGAGGFGCTKGCFELSETQMTDATSTPRTA